MHTKIASFIADPKSRNVVINTVGNFLNVLFVAILQPILFRILTPEEYAVFGVLTTVSYLLINILDFGTPATIYSQLPILLEEGADSVHRFVKSTLFFQTIFAGVVVVGYYFILPYIDEYVLKTEASTLTLTWTALMVIFWVWQVFFLNILFAGKQFLRANIYLNLSNFIRTVAVFALIAFGAVSIENLVFVIGIFGPIVFLCLVLFDKRKHITLVNKAPIDRSDFRFSYTLTYFAATQFLNTGLRLDLLIMSNMRSVVSQAQVGWYAAAQKIVLTLLTAIISITQVLSPAFSKVKTQAMARAEFKHGLVYMLLPIGLYLGVLITPEWIYQLFFGEMFLNSIPIARVLSIPFTIFALASIPMMFLLYSVKRSGIVLFAYVSFFIVSLAGNLLFIPDFGYFAPAMVFSVGFVLTAVILAIEAYREYRKLPA